MITDNMKETAKDIADDVMKKIKKYKENNGQVAVFKAGYVMQLHSVIMFMMLWNPKKKTELIISESKKT